MLLVSSRPSVSRRAIRRVAAMVLVLAAVVTSGHSIASDRELTESSDFRVRVQAALRLGRTGGTSARADLEVGLRDAHLVLFMF